MITRMSPIEHIEHTVDNLVIVQVIKDLQLHIFDKYDIQLIRDDIYDNASKSISSDIDDPLHNKTIVRISVTVKSEEELSLSNVTKNPRNEILLYDEVTKLTVRPMYIPSIFNFTFSYQDANKGRVKTILNKLTAFYDISSMYGLRHDLPYDYYIPKNVYPVLNHIRQLQEFNGNVLDYVSHIAKVKYDLAINKKDTYKTVVFRNISNAIIGRFRENPLELEVTKDDSLYELEFTYQLQVSRPIAMAITYPFIVNNKPIDNSLIPKQHQVFEVKTAGGLIDLSSIINLQIENPKNIMYMYRYPTYDTFIPKITGANDRPKILSLLLTVDESDLHSIVNFNDIVSLGISDVIADHIRSRTSKDLFTVGSDIFYFELYDENNIHFVDMYIDDDFNIRSTIPLQTSKSYHLVLTILLTLDDIDKSVISAREYIDIYEHLKVSYIYNNRDSVKLSHSRTGE